MNDERGATLPAAGALADEPLSVPRLLHLSDALQSDVVDAAGAAGTPATPRGRLATLFARVAFEHWASQRLLLRASLDVTAFALVRLQFEAVVRTAWIVECASHDWIERFIAPQADGTLKEPTSSPTVPDMLAALAAKAPVVTGMLAQLKADAWQPMHSYVHSGARPLAHAVTGSTEYQVSAVLRNANGLGLIAFNAFTIACAAPALRGAVARLQRRYQACLPPATATG